jgi:4-hydroxy 2-oxovalerate aldolase
MNSNMEATNLKIIDVTVKEGGFRNNHHFLPEQAADIAKELERSGIKYAEICHGCGIGSIHRGFPGYCPDKDLLSAAKKAAPNLTYCVFISGSPAGVMEIEPLSEYFDMGRVGINVPQAKTTKSHFKALKNLGKTAIGQLLRIHNRSPAETVEAAQILVDQGADIIFLTDNYGSMSPAEIPEYVEAVKTKINKPIGFHGRNNTDQAIANSLAAIDSGAEWIDGAVLGMGRGAGCTNLEILVHQLKQKGLCRDIDLTELTFAAKNHVLPAIRNLPYAKYIDILFAKHRIDYYPEGLMVKIAEILEMDPEEFLLDLKKLKADMVQLTNDDLKEYLAGKKLDLGVVLKFIETGEVFPSA